MDVKTNIVKRQFPAATTKTHHGARNEAAHIKGMTKKPKTGNALVFTPPGVVKIFIVGLAVKTSTTIIPAIPTLFKRFSVNASISRSMSIVRIVISKELEPAKAAG